MRASNKLYRATGRVMIKSFPGLLGDGVEENRRCQPLELAQGDLGQKIFFRGFMC